MKFLRTYFFFLVEFLKKSKKKKILGNNHNFVEFFVAEKHKKKKFKNVLLFDSEGLGDQLGQDVEAGDLRVHAELLDLDYSVGVCGDFDELVVVVVAVERDDIVLVEQGRSGRGRCALACILILASI
jgi:hypothetical protein